MSVIIVIPIYQEKLNKYEEISLAQLELIMPQYPKVYVAPKSLMFSYINKYNVIRFADDFFKNIDSYGELLLRREFYDEFTDYDYVLIYQLDAFVFRDNLSYFCKQGYDYVGAPLRGGDWCEFHVGNGGLSLRNVKKCKGVLLFREKIEEEIYKVIPSKHIAEDVFWSYCGVCEWLDFSVPSPRIAALFSVQNDYYHGMRYIKKRGLPFGCHYWYRSNYNFWKPYIESFGYDLDKVNEENTGEALENDKKNRLLYLTRRCVREIIKKQKIDCLNKVLPFEKEYSIFGAGKDCKCFLETFSLLMFKYSINTIYDNNPKVEEVNGIPVKKARYDEVRKENIIIATRRGEWEIKEQLAKWGMVEGEDCWSFFEICRQIVKEVKSNKTCWPLYERVLL